MDQIMGAEGFSIMDNLRLVVIAGIFIIIVAAFLLSRIVRTQGKPGRKQMQEEQEYEDSEEGASNVAEEFFGSGESSEEGDVLESTAESEVEIEKKPVINLEKIEADIKSIKDDVTTEIEGLILKIEAGEKEVINKVEDVINTKIQEALSKINDRISETLQTQKNSTASVLEKLVDSLRTEEVSAGILPSSEPEKTVEEAGRIELETSEEGKDISEKMPESLPQIEEEPVGIPPSQEFKEVVEEKVEFEEMKEEELEMPSEANQNDEVPGEAPVEFAVAEEEKVDEKVPAEAVTPSEGIEQKILETAKAEEVKEEEQKQEEEKVPGETSDFDIQDFLSELETPPSESDLESEK